MRHCFGSPQFLVAVLVVGVLAAAGLADNVVVQVDGVVVATPAPGASASISLPSSARLVNIYVNPLGSSANIGRLTFTGGPTSIANLDFVLGTGAFVDTDTNPTSVGGNWAGINCSGVNSVAVVRLYGGIGGNLTNQITGIEQISRFDVDGNVQSTIFAESALNGTLFSIQAGGITSSGSVSITDGTITSVDVDADIAGNIVNANGDIVFVRSFGGNITGNISASNGFINEVVAGGAIFGPVTSNTITAGTGIGSVDAATGINSVINAGGPISRVMVSSVGNLRGSISASSIISGNVNDGIIVTNGRLFANITTTGNVSRQISVRGTSDPLGTLEGAISIGGALTAGTSITLERSLAGAISFPANGLQGQIIVNGDNVGGMWSGTVNVGSIALSLGQSQPNQAPYYTRLASTLGGGSVGLAPFYLHGTNCTPAHDLAGSGIGIAADAINADLNAHVFCTFYGPIAKLTPGDTWNEHFTIWCKPLGSTSCTWLQVNEAFTVLGPGEGTWSQPRALGIRRASSDIFVAPGLYRLEPISADAVRCAGVAGTPSVVWPELPCDDSGIGLGYVFKVTGEGADCHLADFNGSGGVTVQDLFDFLAAYFAADPAADINGSNSVTVQDIFDYLAAYFGCGPT